MKTFILLVFAATSTIAYGQARLSGTVKDAAGKPLPFVTVVLLKPDSSLVKSTASDSGGRYAFENVRLGAYRLAASGVGFRKIASPPFAVESPSTSGPTLTLAESTSQLSEVTIAIKKPFVEQKIDRMVVNVAGSIIGSGSTALEVLERSPGVTVDYQNETLQLRGKEGVIVQIDGRQSYLSPQDVIALLRTMSSDNIEKVELITNPSSRYDAAGNSGIINIQLKKNRSLGTNGSLSAALGTGRYDRERGGLQLNHRTAKLNLFGSYSLNRGGNFFDFLLKRNQPDPSPTAPGRRNLVETYTYLRFRDLGQNAKAGFDFMPTKQTTIGLVWTGLWSDHRERGPAYGTFRRTENGPVYLWTGTEKTYNTNSLNQVGNLNFQHSLGEKGGQLNADVDVGYFQRDFSNRLLTTVLIPDGQTEPSELLNTQPTEINIFTAKADYTRPLRNGWRLETGLKTASVRTDNDLTLSLGPPGEIVRNPDLSTRFLYTERVNAAYASASGKWGKTQVQAGLRAEHTHSEGNAVTMRQVVTRNYLNLFPSLFLTRPLAGDRTLNASYSYRIDRPNYQFLNPARGYVDPYTYSQGNAFLRPQYTHALEVRYAFKNGLFVSAGANYLRDMFSYVVYVTEGNTGYRFAQNIGRSQGYTATLGWPVTVTKGWQLQTNWLAYFNRYQFRYESTDLRIDNFSGRLNANNAFTFGKGWTGELNGWLQTPSVTVLFRTPWLGSLDAGVQKAVTSALKLKLSAQDVFRSNQVIGGADQPGNSQSVRIKFDTRVVLLNLTYSFGNQQVKAARQRQTASEEESRRAN
ncbi:outer membrane beta-barrel protein [Tellurirhabdus rosea]|uniref:outer membrane beta-barrel protein n=1 Tax=Tellurirhabdus rosea TaxID=2674997 RepID=UPI0022537CC1|nr:TonB-dependent receptor [Tellurirhabdus rosea]